MSHGQEKAKRKTEFKKTNKYIFTKMMITKIYRGGATRTEKAEVLRGKYSTIYYLKTEHRVTRCARRAGNFHSFYDRTLLPCALARTVDRLRP